MKDSLSSYRPLFSFTKSIVYLNHASDGPLPSSSLKAAQDYYRYMTLEKIPSGHAYMFAHVEECRRLCAGLVNAREEEIALSPNTSYGINVVAQGLKLKKGETVLLADNEFPANVYPWLNLKRNGVRVKFVRTENGFFSLDNFQEALDPSCRLVSLSFVQSFNGHKNDLQALSRICQKHDLALVVDGIQGVGCQSLDVKKCGVDFLTCGGSKWLLSTPGTGFFYISHKLQKKLKPTFFGWMGVDWHYNFERPKNYGKKPFPTARRFEIGTYPYPDLALFAASLRLITEVGVERIEAHTKSLLDILIGHLQGTRYRITSSLDPRHRSSILCFTGSKIEHLHRRLERNKVLVSLREGSIRVSPHFYNTPTEIRRLASFIAKSNL